MASKTMAGDRATNEAMKQVALEYIEGDEQMKKLTAAQAIRAKTLKEHLEGLTEKQLDCGDGFYVKLVERKSAAGYSNKIVGWLEEHGLNRLLKKTVEAKKLKAAVKSGEIAEKDIKKFFVPAEPASPALCIERPGEKAKGDAEAEED